MTTTYHFGSQVTTTAFVEYTAVAVTAQDASTIYVSPRPVSGALTLSARVPGTLVELDPITVGDNGYWNTTTDDIPIIEVSADGTNWLPQYAREALDASTGGGADLTAITTRLSADEAATSAVADRVTTLEAGGGGGGGSVATLSGATTVGKAVMSAVDAAAARSAISAGTSNLTLGTTVSTAKAGNYAPAAADISDAGATGRNVLKAATTTAAKSALGVDQVDNTTDLNKPISSATAAALSAKQPTIKQYATQAAAVAAATAGQIASGDLVVVLGA